MKKQHVKHKIPIFYLPFLLIALSLLIAIIIYCYLIKYQAEQDKIPSKIKTINKLQFHYNAMDKKLK